MDKNSLRTTFDIAGGFGLIFFLAACLSCGKTYQVAQQDIRTYQVRNQGPNGSPEMEALLGPYRAELEDEMNAVVAELSMPMSKRRPESTLGNLVTDALLQYCQNQITPPVDFATLNYGGVRIPSLGEGPLLVGKVFELMPFDNMLTVLDLPGPILKKLIDEIAEDGGWPVSKGINFVIEDRLPSEIMIGGKALDLDKTYRVALPDYVADGGGGCDFLEDLPRVEVEPILIRDVLIQELRAMGQQEKLKSEIEGRIVRATN